MLKQRIGLLIVVFISSFHLAVAQETPVYKKNAVAFNLTDLGVNEINLSFEHRYSIRRGIELNVGYFYINDPLKKLANSWVNTQYFYERGFAARFRYKIFRKLNDDSKWRDYISPGISYKYLYYNNQDFDGTADGGSFERLNQHRFRHKVALEFLWGKVYEMNQTFAFEFYYGAGLTGTLSDRYVNTTTDFIRNKAQATQIINDHDKSFYLRPTVLVGFKFKISF